MNPLMKEKAIRFGISHNKIDHHPASKKRVGKEKK